MAPVFEAADDRLVRPRDYLRQAYRFRLFLSFWVQRNLSVRYRQTTLGPVWAVLQPLLSSLVYAFVFSWLMRVQTPVPYVVFVVTNLSLWSYTVRTITLGPTVLFGNLDLVTRIQFPREFLPVGVWCESLVDLALGTIVLAGFFAYYQVPLTRYALLAVPVFIVHTIFILGATFLLAAITISVRDLSYIVPLLLQLALYMAPVVYPLDLVPESLRRVYLLNPFGTIFAAYQETLFSGRFTLWRELAASAAVSVVLLVTSYRLFKRQEWKLADLL